MLGRDAFQDLLDARGPDLARWPWLARHRAARLLQASPEARAMLARARRLDAALAAALKPAPAGEALRARLRAIPALHPHPAPAPALRLVPPRLLWQLGTATATACLVAGFIAGAAGLMAPPADSGVDLAALAYGGVALPGPLPGGPAL